MNYLDFTAGGKDYKLRLNTRNVVDLEKKLNGNPLSVFGDGSTIPSITSMITVLHSSLQQYQHNITLQDTYGIFDAWLEDGHATTDFIEVMLDIYEVSGIINTNEDEDNEEKN